MRSQPTSAVPSAARRCESTKTLLVADDDPTVRDLEVQILRQQGYKVLEAANATEALRLAATTATIHLLITDLLMAEGDTLELTHRFWAVHPKTPVLIVSGSLPLLRARSKLDLDRFEFLAKPFLFDELLQKVHKLLDVATPLPLRRPWCAD
jgi:DNA-binding NtrC family response regulator